MNFGSSKLNIEYLWLLEGLSVHVSHILHSSLTDYLSRTKTSAEDAPLSCSADSACMQASLLLVRWALALVPHVTTIANYDTLKMSGGNKGNDVLALFTPCAHFYCIYSRHSECICSTRHARGRYVSCIDSR